MEQQPPNILNPKCPDMGKSRMKKNYDRKHGAKTLKALEIGDRVRVKTDHEKYLNKTGITRI